MKLQVNCIFLLIDLSVRKKRKSWNRENIKTALESIRNGSKIKTTEKEKIISCLWTEKLH